MVEESETPESDPVADTAEVEGAAVSSAADISTDETPSVDELQDRLADLQGAMDQLQSGDLDGAEATIAALEESMASAQVAE